MRNGDPENNGATNSRRISYFKENRGIERRSWLVPLIVVANVTMFIVTMTVNNCPHNNHLQNGSSNKCVAKFLGRFSFQPLRENPLFGPSSSTLEKLGALQWQKVVHEHQGWRLFTCLWLHAGVIHLLLNMISLIIFGMGIEKRFGFVRVGVIYLLSGVGGSILSSLFIRQNISVGASGAIFGFLGAMLAKLLRNWSIYTDKGTALTTLIIDILINLALGMLPHINDFAHIGGLLSGFLLGFILLALPQSGRSELCDLPANARVVSKYTVFFWMVSMVLLVVGFTKGLIMLFRGENANKECSWCRYLNCTPILKWGCSN